MLTACGVENGQQLASTFDTGVAAYDAGDKAKAFEIWSGIADQDVAAMRNVATMLRKGEGGKQDHARAAVWLKKAATPTLQDGYAEYVLASLYATGRGVTKDDTEAANLMFRAANHAWPDAMSDWGAWLINGRAGYKNPKEAVEWFQKAAEKNHTTACYNLGILYENGMGVDKSLDEAKKWYEKAAKYGHQKAKDAVARLNAG